jgi:hypothetical protein
MQPYHPSRSPIVKTCKPFNDGELVKECFLEIADNLFLKDLKIRDHSYYSRSSIIKKHQCTANRKDV